MRIVLQSHAEGSSLRGISRISGLAYDTFVSIVQVAALKAQMVHNTQVQAVDTDAVGEARVVVVCRKKQKHCLPQELAAVEKLDSLEFSSVKWINSLWSRQQAYRRVSAGVSP